ncbi:MAG: BACON domain-containing protein [Alistipes sp.]|nr:BACON domain-containing protein [Alistipes sp.]
MRINSLVKMLFAMPMLLAATLFSSCDNKGDEVVTPPTVGVSKGEAGETTLSFTVSAIDAEKLAYVVFESSETAPEAEAILADGVALALEQSEPVVVSGLTPETEYCIIAAASNKGGAVKSAPVTMTTLKAQVPVDEISFDIVAGETAEFEAVGGNGEIEFEMGAPVYPIESLEATCEAEWIKDIKVVAAESKVTYTVEANTKSESRSAKIVLTYAEITREATISQKPHVEENKPALSLKSETTVKFAAEGGNGTIKYELINPADGVEVKATCEAAWVSAIAVDATNSEVAFTVAANEAYEARNAKVKVAYGDLSFEVAVEQAAAEKPAEPELTLKSGATKEFAAEGGNGEFTYELKNAVEGTTLATDCKAEWISKIAIDEKNSKVTYTVAANETEEAREAKITLTYGELKVEANVKQAGAVKEEEKEEEEEANYTLTITSDPVRSFEAEGGKGEIAYTIDNPSKSVELETRIEGGADWVTISSTTDTVVNYFVSANNETTQREAKIYLVYGTQEQHIRIVQRGKEVADDITECQFTVAHLGHSTAGGIQVVFADANDTYQLFATFFTEEKYIPAGTYATGYSGSLSPESYMYANGENHKFNQESNSTENSIVVELAADDTYTFTFNNLLFGKEYVATGSWTGKIEGLGANVAEEEFEPTHVATQWMWGGYNSSFWSNYYIVSGEGFSMEVHFCTDVATETTLAAGDYKWGGQYTISNSTPEKFSTYRVKINGADVYAGNGEMSVTEKNGSYTIKLSIVNRDTNETYGIIFNGKLNEANSEVKESVVNVTQYNDGGQDDTLHARIFKLYDNDGNQAHLYINADAVDNQTLVVTPGTYTWVSIGQVGELSSYFATNNIVVNGESKTAKSGTLVVEESGEFTMSLTMTDLSKVKFVVSKEYLGK